MSSSAKQPLAVVVQSSSSAGKTSLMDAVLDFMPEEQRESYSAVTSQALFYMGQKNLKHKILAVSEEEGAERASYPLKLLQSEGKLKIASTGKDPISGKHVTHEYVVEGPVMIFLTTTKQDVDEELLNRIAGDTGSSHKFTGKERDTETGLDYYGKRYYSNGFGRWTSPDPQAIALRHLMNPQKLNRYVYVLNNPIGEVDPDGLEDIKVFVHFNPGDPVPKNPTNWGAIQSNASQHGNTVTVFEGDKASAANYQSSLSSGGTTVFIGHTQLVDNGGGPKVAAVSLADKEVGQPVTKPGEIGAGRTLDPPAGVIGALPYNVPGELPANVNSSSTVALFGCDSAGLAGQYSNASTFVGVNTTTSTEGLMDAGTAFVNSLASGNTVGRAVTDANGQINQIPSMDSNSKVQVVPKKQEQQQ